MAKKGEKIPEEVLEARRKFRGIRSRKASGDFEVAHSDEDDFRLWVL